MIIILNWLAYLRFLVDILSRLLTTATWLQIRLAVYACYSHIICDKVQFQNNTGYLTITFCALKEKLCKWKTERLKIMLKYPSKVSLILNKLKSCSAKNVVKMMDAGESVHIIVAPWWPNGHWCRVIRYTEMCSSVYPPFPLKEEVDWWVQTGVEMNNKEHRV